MLINNRVDVILTNPPFGGEEEKGILGGFPQDMQTAETALLFLQLIMRKLRRPGQGAENGGRAAVVVPNGTLFADGIAGRIKEALVKGFNLHTIVRLPEGVFSPYTDIPANLLFFDRSGPTQDIWFYQIPPPEGRKKYSKTKPMDYAEFEACLSWWGQREENAHAWKLPFADRLTAAREQAQPPLGRRRAGAAGGAGDRTVAAGSGEAARHLAGAAGARAHGTGADRARDPRLEASAPGAACPAEGGAGPR